MDADARAHYELGAEQARLGPDDTEYVRTLELLERFLPPAPARVLDVGGGAGVYAVELGRRGYEVTLVDAMPLHVDQARALGVDARVGDARNLDEPDSSWDATLLLGPLYHLTERPDRVRALVEAQRVTSPGGVVLAAAISRYASLVGGIILDWLGEGAFRAIVEQDLRDGQHRNPERRPVWFTTTFFHHPDELRSEVVDAGLEPEAMLAIEGVASLRVGLPKDVVEREWLLRATRQLEAEPSLLGISSHILGVARVP
jgi:SAM-dependent methyltransferase